MFKGGWLMTQPSAAVQGWLVRSFHFPNTIPGCSRVAGPFFSLVPNNHLPRCGAVAKCNPGGQPSTSVQSATAWVQRMGGHLWTSKWIFAVRRTYQTYIYTVQVNIYIYIYIPTYIRTEVRLRRHKGARFARPKYYIRVFCVLALSAFSILLMRVRCVAS